MPVSDMLYPNIFLETIVKVPNKVNDKAKPKEVNDAVKTIIIEIDVWQQFTNDQISSARQHMLEWVRMEARKLRFGIVIGRSDNGTSRK